VRLKTVFHVLSFVLVLLGGALLVPLFISLYTKEGDAASFFVSVIVCLVIGVLLYFLTRQKLKIGTKESFGIVAFGWITLALFGSLPFCLYFQMTTGTFSFTNCFFETMSGFTTTGATIFSDIESLPKGILFWRNLTQWLGGMGIIVLTLAILPLIGVGGSTQLFRAEAPGPTTDKLRPLIKDTAKILWGVYLLLTGSVIILLLFGGMPLFDAVCHSFTTIATGGFSTQNNSIGAYSSYIQVVILIAMVLGAISFSLHFQALSGNFRQYWKNPELVVFLAIILGVGSLVTLDLFWRGEESIGNAALKGFFQVASIGSSTGYTTTDYGQWSAFSQFVIFGLMFIGGCGGSTAGGMKVIRIMILAKFAVARMKSLIHPSAIFRVRLGKVVVQDQILLTVSGFFILFAISFGVSILLVSLSGVEFKTAISCVTSCITNVGPGLGEVGPSQNYAFLPDPAKWVLMFCMLLGRLEIYTLLLLFIPETWRR